MASWAWEKLALPAVCRAACKPWLVCLPAVHASHLVLVLWPDQLHIPELHFCRDKNRSCRSWCTAFPCSIVGRRALYLGKRAQRLPRQACTNIAWDLPAVLHGAAAKK